MPPYIEEVATTLASTTASSPSSSSDLCKKSCLSYVDDMASNLAKIRSLSLCCSISVDWEVLTSILYHWIFELTIQLILLMEVVTFVCVLPSSINNISVQSSTNVQDACHFL